MGRSKMLWVHLLVQTDKSLKYYRKLLLQLTVGLTLLKSLPLLLLDYFRLILFSYGLLAIKNGAHENSTH